VRRPAGCKRRSTRRLFRDRARQGQHSRLPTGLARVRALERIRPLTPERRRELHRLDYQRHRETRIGKVAEYQAAHPEVNREASRRYRALNRKKRRDTILRYRYKLSAADFETMILKQGQRCLSCGNKPSRFYVDHDHDCCPRTPTCGQCTRGLVCNGCNTYDRLGSQHLDSMGRMRGGGLRGVDH